MRLIEATEVIKRIDVVIGSEPKAWDKKALSELKMYVVHAVPTVDAVEVIRCKDCKYWYKHICDFWSTDSSMLTKHDDFCSYGERADT